MPLSRDEMEKPAENAVNFGRVARPTRLQTFDKAMAGGAVTTARGDAYGHPAIDFDRAARIKAVTAECPNPVVRHVLDMLAVKIARLIETPSHLDSWTDIAGYARTGVMATELDAPQPARHQHEFVHQDVAEIYMGHAQLSDDELAGWSVDGTTNPWWKIAQTFSQPATAPTPDAIALANAVSMTVTATNRGHALAAAGFWNQAVELARKIAP